jgi:hypothetical protein
VKALGVLDPSRVEVEVKDVANLEEYDNNDIGL